MHSDLLFFRKRQRSHRHMIHSLHGAPAPSEPTPTPSQGKRGGGGEDILLVSLQNLLWVEAVCVCV